jgi:alcohol oxidase
MVNSCVVAGRLANLDHNLQVMLIEAGESNLNNPWVYRPGIYPRNMFVVPDANQTAQC